VVLIFVTSGFCDLIKPKKIFVIPLSIAWSRKPIIYAARHYLLKNTLMTTIENHQLKGITIKNVIVTIVSTASIVASVITTYFGLKTDIQIIKSAQEAEARINNIRITVLENQVSLLQKEVYEIRFSGKTFVPAIKGNEISKVADPAMLSAIHKR
jgi:hypothetical protein